MKTFCDIIMNHDYKTCAKQHYAKGTITGQINSSDFKNIRQFDKLQLNGSLLIAQDVGGSTCYFNFVWSKSPIIFVFCDSQTSNYHDYKECRMKAV